MLHQPPIAGAPRHLSTYSSKFVASKATSRVASLVTNWNLHCRCRGVLVKLCLGGMCKGYLSQECILWLLLMRLYSNHTHATACAHYTSAALTQQST